MPEFTIDKAAIKRRVSETQGKFLFTFGAMVRTIARRSIRHTKNTEAQPGQPPKSHAKGDPIKLIQFAVDKDIGDVIVGPIYFARAKRAGVATPEIEAHNPFMNPAFEKALKFFFGG